MPFWQATAGHHWSVHQHAYLNQAGQSETVAKKRKQVWSALDALLASLPARSRILLAGDFNALLRREDKLVGPGLLDKCLTDRECEDRELVMRVLTRHRLCALNTWGAKKRAATDLHPKAVSQIDYDYVCVRQPLADGQAKLTRPRAFPLAGWRSVGHRPLVGSVPRRWTPWIGSAGRNI